MDLNEAIRVLEKEVKTLEKLRNQYIKNLKALQSATLKVNSFEARLEEKQKKLTELELNLTQQALKLKEKEAKIEHFEALEEIRKNVVNQKINFDVFVAKEKERLAQLEAQLNEKKAQIDAKEANLIKRELALDEEKKTYKEKIERELLAKFLSK